MSVLGRLPALATCGVGSLPFDDPDEAAAHAVTAYDVPFCPQLPAVEGDMIETWLGADPARCGWSPARDAARPLAWEPFLAALWRSPPAHRVVKLQVTGPLTLACALERAQGAACPSTATLELAVEVAHWLAANVAGQVRELADRGLDAIVLADEPLLAVAAAPGAERAWDPLRAVAPAWGLHACCAVPWPTVARAEVDVLSFDLSTGAPDGEVLRDIADRGGRIAWGVTDPAALRDMGIAEADSLVTPPCGTGMLAPDDERRIARELRGARRSLA